MKLVLPVFQSNRFNLFWIDIKTAKEGFKMNDLTSRERQVFDLLAEGLKTEDIAKKLSITKNTVKYFTKRIYKKLGVKSKSELIIWYHNYQSNATG